MKSKLLVLFIFLGLNSFSQVKYHIVLNLVDQIRGINYFNSPKSVVFFENKTYTLSTSSLILDEEGGLLYAIDNAISNMAAVKNGGFIITTGGVMIFSKDTVNRVIRVKIDAKGKAVESIEFVGFKTEYQFGRDLLILPNQHTLYACIQGVKGGLSTKSGLFLRTDENQKAVWAMEITDTIKTSAFMKVQTDEKSNIYLFGNSEGKSKNEEIIVVKLDSAGKFLWSKNFGGTSLNTINDAYVTKNGDTYMVGQTLTNAKFGIADAFLIKLDSNGKQLWAKVFDGGSISAFHKIKEDPNGGLYALGRKTNYNRNCKGRKCFDVYFLQMDTAGTILNGITLGVEGKWDVGYCFDMKGDNEIIIGGQSGQLDNNVLNDPAFFYSSTGIKGFCDSKTDTSRVANVTFAELPGVGIRNIPLFRDSTITLFNTDFMPIALEDKYCSTVSVNEEKSSRKTFTIYPNPTSESFSVSGNFEGTKTLGIKLYTMQGQLVLEQEMSENEKLDVSLLQNGTYILLIKSKGIVQREIIVVE